MLDMNTNRRQKNLTKELKTRWELEAITAHSTEEAFGILKKKKLLALPRWTGQAGLHKDYSAHGSCGMFPATMGPPKAMPEAGRRTGGTSCSICLI